MSLDLQKIRERVEEAIDQWSETLPLSQADPSGLFSLLDSLHCLNVLEREERDRFPIVYAEVPGTGDALKPYIPLDLMGLAHDVIQAAIAYRDKHMAEDGLIARSGDTSAETRALVAAVRAYREKVKQ